VCVPGFGAPDLRDHLVGLVLRGHHEGVPVAAPAGHARAIGDHASRSWSTGAVYFGAGAGAAGAGAGAAGAGAGAAAAGAAAAGAAAAGAAAAGAAAAGAGAGTTTTVGAGAAAGAVAAEPTAAPATKAAPRPRIACASDISVPDRYGMSAIAIKESIETVAAIV